MRKIKKYFKRIIELLEEISGKLDGNQESVPDPPGTGDDDGNG